MLGSSLRLAAGSWIAGLALAGCSLAPRQKPDVRIVAIAVNDADDYRMAACLGIDAVLTDSPARMAAIRDGIALPLRCARSNAN
jgi:hypothetical protein